MAVLKSRQTRLVGILTYNVHPYICFSSNSTVFLRNECRDVRCMLVSLLTLFAYFLALPSLLPFFQFVLFFILVTANFYTQHCMSVSNLQRPVAYNSVAVEGRHSSQFNISLDLLDTQSS